MQHHLAEFLPDLSHPGLQPLSVESSLVLLVLVIGLLLDGIEHALVYAVVVGGEYFLDDVQVLLLEYGYLDVFVLVVVVVETLVADVAVVLALSLHADELHVFLGMHGTLLSFAHHILLY